MSINAPSLFGQQFATVVELLLQQKDSRFSPAVTIGHYKGEQASPVDQIGAVEMQEVTTRFGAIVRTDAAVDRRWVQPTDFDLAQLMDPFDELKILTDPKSKYVQNAVQAAHRKMDDLILDAMFGTAKTGKAGTTSTSFTSTQKIEEDFGASADVKMTVKKLKRARKILKANHVDLDSDMIFCALNAEQEEALLDEAQVISSDYNGGKPVLVDGKLKSFLGINFLHTERLDLDSNGDVLVPVWAKSGMHLGIWADPVTDVDRRKDLTGLPWQVYLKMSMGATRIEEKKIVQIQNHVE